MSYLKNTVIVYLVTSYMNPVNNKPIASAMVEKDKGKLLCVGVT